MYDFSFYHINCLYSYMMNIRWHWLLRRGHVDGNTILCFEWHQVLLLNWSFAFTCYRIGFLNSCIDEKWKLWPFAKFTLDLDLIIWPQHRNKLLTDHESESSSVFILLFAVIKCGIHLEEILLDIFWHSISCDGNCYSQKSKSLLITLV
jgi:hypothetical protein